MQHPLQDAVSIAGSVAHRIELGTDDIETIYGVYSHLSMFHGRAVAKRYLEAERADAEVMLHLVKNRRRRDAAKAAARARIA